MRRLIRKGQLRPPRIWLFVVLTMVVLSISSVLYPRAWTLEELGFGTYLSIVWTLPVGLSVMAMIGAAKARRAMSRRAPHGARTACDRRLVVQVPTIGRHDVMPALRRVVDSMEQSLPANFTDWRVDVVAEETSEARNEMDALGSEHVRVLYVPSEYATPNGSQAKARANCWIDELRKQEGEATGDVWVLHMDDDTAIAPDTCEELSRFINANPFGEPTAKVLAQGVLTYPRQFSSKGLVWLADAVRPGSDLSIFHLWTGGGRPLLGAHGELLLVRADIEARIGWDYGRLLSITEDANFALRFATLFPGRSDWFAGRCYGSAPESFRDLVKQRKRWARGLLHVAGNRNVPLRNRLLLRYALATWVLGPLQHVLIVLGVAALLGVRYTAPVQAWILLPWAINMGFGLWLYIDGLRANVSASGGDVARRYWLGLLLIPFFSLVEGWAGLSGLVAFLKDRLGWGRSELFEVIKKTHEVPVSTGGSRAA